MDRKNIDSDVLFWAIVLMGMVVIGGVIRRVRHNFWQIYPWPVSSMESCDPYNCLGDTRVRPIDGMTMVYVPDGEFLMGSEDESPIHRVALDSFWIDQTEVTNAQYVKFLNQIVESAEIVDDEVIYYHCYPIYDLICDSCPRDNRITWDGTQFDTLSEYRELPVVMVSWYGAQEYCAWAGGQLPTEAQWEYAARGPEGNPYPWGDFTDCARGNFDDETLWDQYVVEGGEGCDGYQDKAPVGSFPEGASWVGVLDMSGNVKEWIADWKGGYESHWRQMNPTGPEEGELRVTRGDAYSDHLIAPATERRTFMPRNMNNVVGFRCAFAQPEQTP